VLPSPKSQNRFVIAPVEVSLKFAVNGALPLSGVGWKLETGGSML
jgi:hypothetical protein